VSNIKRLKELKMLCDNARQQKRWDLCTKYHMEEMDIYNKMIGINMKITGICIGLLFIIKIVRLIF